MPSFPYRVTVAIPTYLEEATYGSGAKHPPSSIRMPKHEQDVIDKAIKITDFGISRGAFIRIAAFRVANEIVKHHEQYIRSKKEEQDARAKRAIQSTKEA